MTVDLRTFVERASQRVERILERTRQLRPMYHIVDVSGEETVLPAPPTDKCLGIAIMKAYFAIHSTQRYVFIDEGWTLTVSSLSPAEIEQTFADGIANHPLRVEVVMFCAEDRDTGMLMAQRPILRPASGKPRLGPLKIGEAGGAFEGRMVGLLPRVSASVQ